mmetsp:Transcript_21892/g.49932  ORF Transcript_21892/g.49932 Transcript_21892/m.49932 type:complete len:897 (-) Transcript_21892:157-2847(-)
MASAGTGAKNSAQGQAGQSLKQPLLPKAQDDVLDEIAEDWRNLPWFQVGNPLAKAETDDPDEVDPGPGPSVKAFKNNLRLAARTGLFCLLCATAVFLPGIYEQIDPNYGSLIGGGVVVLLIFTVYKNLGNTVQLAWQGFSGTLAACLVTHVMDAIFPHGAAGHSYYAPVVHTVNVLVIFLGLFVNIPKNTRMFLLSYHCYFMMDFMDPASTSYRNKTFAIDLDSTTTTTIVTATAGVLVAILVMLFPYPKTAWKENASGAKETTADLLALVDEMWQYFAGSEASVKVVQLEAIVLSLRGSGESMQAAVDAAWWEGFDLFGWGRRRMLYQSHLKMLERMATLVFAMLVCVSKEDFGESHKKVMATMRESITDLVTKVGKLLIATCGAVCTIYNQKRHKENLEPLIAETKEAVKVLSATFSKCRQENSPNRKIAVDLQSEAYFCYALCIYARYAMEHAEKVYTAPPKAPGWFGMWKASTKGMFSSSIITEDPDYRSFTTRNTVSIVITYYLGFFLLGKSAIAAGTTALLISNFAGSALLKNLGRLQGVVIGNIVPHFIREMLGESCDPFQIVTRCVTVLLFEVAANYVYYSSPAFGYIGCLVAAFAAPNLIYPCTAHQTAEQAEAQEVGFKQTAFKKIVETTIAVCVMTGVDTVLAPDRASAKAIDKLLTSLHVLDLGFFYSFMPRKANGNLKKDPHKKRPSAYLIKDSISVKPPDASHLIFTRIGEAMAMGAEASKEPRYYRVAWNDDLFNELIRLAQVLRADLRLVEMVLQGSDGLYSCPFGSLRDARAFGKCRDDLCATMDDCIHLVHEVLTNETGKPMKYIVEKLQTLEKCDEIDAMPELIAAINTNNEPYPSTPADTLEDDKICRLNVILMVYAATVENMATMVKVLIKNAYI